MSQRAAFLTLRASTSTRRIWLVRHGESEANANWRISTPEDVVLTDLGRRQAEDFAELVDEPPGLVVTSPFIRTKLTAAPLLAQFPAVAQDEWPIQEFTYLSPHRTANSTLDERRPLVAAWWARRDPAFRDHPETECFEDVLKRARGFLERIGEVPPGLTVAFSHAQFIRIVRLVAHAPESAARDLMDAYVEDVERFPIGNCAVMVFERA